MFGKVVRLLRRLTRYGAEGCKRLAAGVGSRHAHWWDDFWTFLFFSEAVVCS